MTGDAAIAAVAMSGVGRRFGSTIALADVDIEIARGEIHALLGENGAGKTTLMRILAGLDSADTGEVRIDGTVVEHATPRSMIDRGVALVQQHFTLVGRLTAAENLVLARPTDWRLPSRAKAVERLMALTEKYGLPVRPDIPAAALSVGEQQRLEVVRALDHDPRVLVLDEPTAVLTDQEADRLLEVCRSLADEGRSVVMISHRLREVLAGADRVTVLRRGRVVVAGEPVAAHDRRSLVRAMVGDELIPHSTGTGRVRRIGVERIRLSAVAAGRLDPIDLSVRAGEVVGIAGVDGNGQTELEAILAGRVAPVSGTAEIDGEPIPIGSPRRRIDEGVAYIAADRYRHAVVRELSVADNLDLGRTRWWRRRASRRISAAGPRLEAWDVRGERAARAGSLSGGNAQKLVLARELEHPPAVVIAGHPTRGLDPGAAGTVAERVVTAADAGAAVVWIGAELDELTAVADRLVVLCTGYAPHTFVPPYDRHAIGHAMAGGVRVDQAHVDRAHVGKAVGREPIDEVPIDGLPA
ncbi:ABC transporter ATP-binding protein [Desertimonas flava]|uniref:ABC transporter ATP-binding protein n=1 Tax=Desertimonas flava TaxID=2064846 RepID=UPI000E3412FE|nr:ATP-binding cassette domain-containing protein [Desertimonas flava]